MPSAHILTRLYDIINFLCNASICYFVFSFRSSFPCFSLRLIYALDTQTGKALPDYPVAHAGHRFVVPPLLLVGLGSSESVALMAQDSDAIVIGDLKQPNQSHVLSFLGEKSYLGPSLLPYKMRDGCSVLLPFADGAVGCFTPQALFSSGP